MQTESTSLNAVTFELTPNPASMKFNLPMRVCDVGFEVPTAQEAERSPLAAKIFGFPWTSSVYVGTNFVTVTKQDWVEWDVLARPLCGLIQQHINQGEAVVVDVSSLAQTSNDENAEDTEIVRNIKRVIQNEIRPVVALDGGDIVFSHFAEGVVYLQMRGACSSCPSSQATLKDGIEVRLKEIFPEVNEVKSV